MVGSYDQYLKLLEAAIISNGKKELSSNQIEQFIKSNHLDSDWNIVPSEVQKDMRAIVNKNTQFQPSISLVLPQKVKYSQTSNKKVKTYNTYLRLLEDEIVQNGKKELQLAQIEDFIRKYNLNSDWGIISYEVKKDMMTILNRYSRQVKSTHQPTMQLQHSSVRNHSGSVTKVRSYDAYIHMLEDEILQNKKKELSDSQIGQFISANRLDSEWGITKADVLKDVEVLLSKLDGQERISALRKKQLIGSDKSNNQYIEKKKSGLTEEDKNTVLLLRDMLKTYPDLIENNRRLKSAIADMLFGKKKEVNLLGTLVEENIIQVIRNNSTLDQVLCYRFASILEEEYGTSMELATRMVLIWFHAYGRLILDKDIE